MYLDFYGLSESPFNLTPDANFLYPSRVHREVLAHLLYGVNSRKGFIMVSGEVGSGKTTICRALLKKLGPNTEVALILNSFLSELELLKTINEELGIQTTGQTKKELIDELNRFLLDQRMKGKNVVLVIDEAQNLSFPVLEQIRMLSNLETEKEKLLQIVLVGQPELRRLLGSPKLRQLNQRITVRHHITPLTRHETIQYIYHRLKVAGSSGNVVFTKSALNEIYRFSRGIPRMVNVICDQALLAGYVANSMRIDRKMVLASETEIEGIGKQPVRFMSREFSIARVGAGVGLVLAAALIAFSALQTITGKSLLPQRPEEFVGRIARTDSGSPAEGESPAGAPGAARVLREPPELLAEPAPSVMRLAFLAGATSRIGQTIPDILTVGMEPLFREDPEPLTVLPPRPKVDIPKASPLAKAPERQVLAYRSLIDPLCALLRAWKRPPELIEAVRERYNEVGGHLPNLAAAAKMGWLSLRAPIERLREIDLPVVVEMIGDVDEQRGFVAVINMGETWVELATADGTKRVDMQLFSRLYGGNAVVLCGDDFVEPSVLRQGQSLSLSVRKLQDYMKEGGYFAGNPSGWFTPETTAAVMAFQRDHRLPVSGEADGYTRLFLYASRDGTNVPHLRPPG
jgi:general secretion pathway protein A